MRIRHVVLIVGITGTLVTTQLVGSALADPKPDLLAQAKQVLASYGQTNQMVAACMRSKGLSYDARLTKLDVIDAFSIIPPNEVTDTIRTELAARTKAAAAEDPNDRLMAGMAPQAQSFWAEAVNECSMRVESQLSGGAEARAKVAEAERAALASPEVQAAAQVYVNCMRTQGFTVDVNPFVAPQAISEAEHGASAAEIATVDEYNNAWRTCVQPWQKAFDQKLFG
jgi:hypothetical protein